MLNDFDKGYLMKIKITMKTYLNMRNLLYTH